MSVRTIAWRDGFPSDCSTDLDHFPSDWGGYEIPDDGVIELSEVDVAGFLRERGAARSVEILGWVEDDSAENSSDQSKGHSLG